MIQRYVSGTSSGIFLFFTVLTLLTVGRCLLGNQSSPYFLCRQSVTLVTILLHLVLFIALCIVAMFTFSHLAHLSRTWITLSPTLSPTSSPTSSPPLPPSKTDEQRRHVLGVNSGSSKSWKVRERDGARKYTNMMRERGGPIV